MQGAEERAVCSVCGPDQKVQHSEHTVDDQGAQWLLPKLPQQRGQVRLNSDLSGSFPIIKGVKQGWVLAPTLFSIFFCTILKQVIEDLNDDSAVYICNRLDGSLFNLRRTHTPAKTLEQLLRDFLFAADAVLVAYTERAVHLTSRFEEASQLFRLCNIARYPDMWNVHGMFITYIHRTKESWNTKNTYDFLL